MRKSKFTEVRIIGFHKQAEAGMAVVEICRKGGFSDATFYKWRTRTPAETLVRREGAGHPRPAARGTRPWCG